MRRVKRTVRSTLAVTSDTLAGLCFVPAIRWAAQCLDCGEQIGRTLWTLVHWLAFLIG